MVSIAIDGACRRNGKPNCISTSSMFVLHFNDDGSIEKTLYNVFMENKSSNQRGELFALLSAIEYAFIVDESIQLITDSEYLFNALTKEWYKNWINKGWVTARNAPVKNRDIWQNIAEALKQCEENHIEIIPYYIKGHLASFGKATALKLLKQDNTGHKLYEAVKEKIEAKEFKYEIIEMVNDLSFKNNGFVLVGKLFRHFVTLNVMADTLASLGADFLDPYKK